MAIEAFRIATEFMTPVILLTDGYLANGAEPWLIPKIDSLPSFNITHPQAEDDYHPYARNEKLARPWALPGTPNLEHRLGGLEKMDGSGTVCYDPENHDQMCRIRRRKIEGIAETIPPLKVSGDDSGVLLVLGWGSTYGAITSAVDRCREDGLNVSSAHLRYLDPMPKNTAEVLKKFKQVLVPEMNLGQLVHIIRSKYLVDAIGLNKVQGKPFAIQEIVSKIGELINGGKS
jgi:2-oxoglutarate ferredoxin oxidoreductase subunit alpha